MKLGSLYRLLGRGAAPARGEGSARGAPRLRLGVDGRGLWLGRDHAARLSGRADQAHPPRHRHHAARRAPARGGGHGRGHGGRPRGRRPRHRRARRLRAADRGGLVRPALGQAHHAHPRLRRHHAEDLRAQGAGLACRPRDRAPLHRARRARRGQAAHVDPAHEPAAADLARHRHRGEREAHRRDRRRLAAAGLRAAPHADAAALARGGLSPRGRRQGARRLRDPAERPGAPSPTT